MSPCSPSRTTTSPAATRSGRTAVSTETSSSDGMPEKSGIESSLREEMSAFSSRSLAAAIVPATRWCIAASFGLQTSSFWCAARAAGMSPSSSARPMPRSKSARAAASPSIQRSRASRRTSR